MQMNAVSGTKTYAYNTLLQDAPSSIPSMNASVPMAHQNVSPWPPAYSAYPATQACNAPPEVPQWSVAAVVPQNMDVLTAYIRTFLKGKPKILGIVLFIAGGLQIILAVGMAVFIPLLSVRSGIVFWGSVFDIIAGSLSIVAENKPNICLVKGSLSMNIISIAVSVITVILNSLDLAFNIDCYNYEPDVYKLYCIKAKVAPTVLIVLFIVINLLVFSVSIAISVFGCRSLQRVPINVTQVFVMQKDGVTAINPSTVPATSHLLPTDTTRYGNINAI